MTSRRSGEYDIVEDANSCFRVPVDVLCNVRLGTGSLPSLVDVQLTTSTAFATTVSQPTMPLASYPSSPTLPLRPATATSSPPAAVIQEEDVPLPQSLVHGNLGHNYSAPSEDPQRRKNVSLSISTECHLLSPPVEFANYLKPLASEKDRKKIQSLSGECMANFLASEGLQRLIVDKEKLTSEWDQLLTERDQITARLPELEAQAAEAIELEARLQQSEQEVVTLGQEAALLRVQFEEAKATWVEVQNTVLAAADRRAVSTERLNNLEAVMNSKAEEVAAAEEKYTRLEKRHERVIEHNKVYNSTICNLDVTLQAARSEQNNLSTGHEEKNLGRGLSVVGFDAKIAKARELESTARRGLPVQPDATDFSGSGSEFLGTKEEPEGDDVEGQDLEPAADPPTSPVGANASLPPDFGDVVA
uniref:Golgin subfamily A member 5-like n=1 Tax=Nicotiana tabacum TaxID=4097 RepID=A0A1S3Z852_TOBAC|nr:PREDICTED: golgin subfamily A member 5-like [Nicotiana tabacum]